ncbi:MAG: hypothetical protein HYX68_29160 [Planctomycetes bacterium]|nr:hypothetical protein [Planctomycetota bacterium]
MCRRITQYGCCLVLLAMAGCTGMFASRGLPADPLFANRKPNETKAVNGPPVAPPFSEPAPPVNSYAGAR